MSKTAEHKRIQNGLDKILEAWKREQPFSKSLDQAGFQYLSLEEMTSHKKFIPNSIVMGFQEDPEVLCFYTKNGINLMPIHLGNVSLHPYKEQLTDEDAELYGFWDAESFIKWYSEYQFNSIVCVKLEADVPEEEAKLIEDMGN